VIASSNRDLLTEVNKGRFRADLYYRLAVFPVTMVPLRDPSRRQDIPLLAQYFVEHLQVRKDQTQAIGAAAAAKLMTHDWPGNVRELRNVIERALIVERSSEITPRSLIFDSPPPSSSSESDGPGGSPSSTAAVVDFPVASSASASPSGFTTGSPGGLAIGSPGGLASNGAAAAVGWPVENGPLPDERLDLPSPCHPSPTAYSNPPAAPLATPPLATPPFTPSAPSASASSPSPFASGGFSLEAAEREFICRALKETGGQRTRAAALLGITRATLHAKLKRYNISPDDANLAHMASG